MAMGATDCLSHVLEAAREAVCASIPYYLYSSLQHVFVCADRDTDHGHPTLSCNADFNAFQEQPPPGGWGVPIRL